MSGHGTIPGVFGKLPARADFVSRGLPASFTDPWHTWLVRGLLALRREMAADFDHACRAAPAWRFVLPPGVCGPAAAAGVMLPSEDAVGRLFPLTLGAVLQDFGPTAAPAAASAWFEALESAGRGALEPALDFEEWLANLQKLPALLPRAAAVPGCVQAPLLCQAFRLAGLPAPSACDANRNALFWSGGSPLVRARAFTAPALPDGTGYRHLIVDPARPAPAEAAS